MTTKTASIYDWVDERLGLSELAAFARHKTVPVHAQSFWYYWGGISLFLFLVQCFTGVLLLVYYRPGAEAYESVRQITFVMHFGWLIRSAHSWSANLMIFSILVHMFSVYFMKAYRKPREFGWLSGMALLGLASVFGFSGYLLPMDELSYFATKVGLRDSSGDSVDRAGDRATCCAADRKSTSSPCSASSRCMSWCLPALFLPLLGFHLWLVQKHGNAVPPSEEAKPAARSQDHAVHAQLPAQGSGDVAYLAQHSGAAGFGLSVALGKQSDSLVPAPVGIHPEWYFMSPFEMLKLLGMVKWLPGEPGEIAGILLFTLGIVLWVLIPFYDTSKESGQRGRAAHYFGLMAVFALLATTAIGYWTIR